MNPDLTRLQPYPFERMAALHAGIRTPDLPTIRLSIGEPRHPAPAFIAEALIEHLHGLSLYPATRGGAALRGAIAAWLQQRFGLPAGSLDPDRHILPVNGTREALFAIAQCLVDRRQSAPLVMMPNPFYQIYEGAALLAGAEAGFYNLTAGNGYLPDFAAVDAATWKRCQMLYLCNPGNPAGQVCDLRTLQALIELAEKYDFTIVSDECYSEIYQPDKPPPGILQAAAAMGNDSYRRCLAVHSLSKRSNVPGLRSGFVAGDAGVIEPFYRYRTYHGCAMPPATQDASLRAWQDEHHVADNRRLYREKFAAVVEILAPVLGVQAPPAGFYLWPRTPIDDESFSRRLLEQQNVVVLPGSYLSRDTPAGNPGRDHVRMALVAPLDECIEAAQRVRAFVETL